MGGGGGSDSSGLGDARALLDKAREEIRRADQPARRNVFLSFAYEDLNQVNLLRGQARSERTDIEFNDWSVREPYDSIRAEYIRARISERIQQSSVTVVFVSASTARSKWVEWEVMESVRVGKRVIGVHSGERVPSPLPRFLKRRDIAILPWGRLSDELARE